MSPQGTLMSTKDAVLMPPKKPTVLPSPRRRRPTNQEIRARAYEIFLLRGALHGSDLEDWLEAERELLERN
jgi:hypothetical protein